MSKEDEYDALVETSYLGRRVVTAHRRHEPLGLRGQRPVRDDPAGSLPLRSNQRTPFVSIPMYPIDRRMPILAANVVICFDASWAQLSLWKIPRCRAVPAQHHGRRLPGRCQLGTRVVELGLVAGDLGGEVLRVDAVHHSPQDRVEQVRH